MTDDAYANASDARDGTIELVSAYVSNSNTRLSGEELQTLIRDTFATLSNLSGGSTATVTAADESQSSPKTKAEIKKSIGAESLVSFEDGKPYKSLKRHLSTRGMTPESYRSKYGLPADYPMTHPAYSARRSELAKSIGLGSKGRAAKAAPAAKGRKPKAPSE
jgi:predicted transcriptional regulator